jgi:hypothetical protein
LTDAMVNKDREEEVIKYHAQRFLWITQVQKE